MIISVISAVIVVLAVGIIVICAVVFSIRRSKRQSVLRHDYDYPIVMLQRQQRTQDQQQVHIDGNLRQESSFNVYNATLATTEGEVAESNSHRNYTTAGMFKMDRNSSYQHSTNFIFARNPAYGTSISMAPKIETEENAAYHCDIAISS